MAVQANSCLLEHLYWTLKLWGKYAFSVLNLAVPIVTTSRRRVNTN